MRPGADTGAQMASRAKTTHRPEARGLGKWVGVHKRDTMSLQRKRLGALQGADTAILSSLKMATVATSTTTGEDAEAAELRGPVCGSQGRCWGLPPARVLSSQAGDLEAGR